MGCLLSRGGAVLPTSLKAKSAPVLLKKFSTDWNIDYNLNPDYYLLRTLLDEPLGQKYLRKHMATKNQKACFVFWLEVHEFREIATMSYRR